jgi:hypothetical protein
MSTWNVILLVAGAMIILPIIAYMVMKFGTAGFFRAKQRELDKQNNKPNHEIE